MLGLLKRFGRPHRRELLIGPACKQVEVIFDLLAPLAVARMVDRGVAQHDTGALLTYGALLIAMALIGFCFTLICQKMAARASQGMGTEMRAALFAHINRLSLAQIDHFGAPSLITRATNDINQVQLAIALAIRQLTRFPLLAIGSMVAAMLIDVEMGSLFFTAIALIGGIFWLVMHHCIPYYRAMQQKLDQMASIAREGLSGMRTVRSYAREPHERERFKRVAGEQALSAMAAGYLSSMLNPATFFVMNMAVCAILWVAGSRVHAGSLTQGQVVAFVNYMAQALLAVVYAVNLVVVFTRASASAARIEEVLGREPDIHDEGDATFGLPCSPCAAASLGVRQAEGADAILNVNPAPPAIRMHEVSFAYPGSAAPALSGVTLQLERGRVLGVIGGTGAGKSTLVSLLPRLYDATHGTVEVLGMDVRSWPLTDLRGHIGLVPQKDQLMSGTIRSNLLWRAERAGDDELWRALKVAQAADFVHAIPLGLDAPVEAGGRNYSGGQRQRLAIARALVGSPALLILDDSTSALDFGTDAALRGALASLDCTMVMVSQRVSSVRHADLICVLHRGRIVGLGTHGELIASCRIYREIARSQSYPGVAVTPCDEGVEPHV